jgi:peptidoglycan/xylan/chitin deacetylase (PgdA/CDA1 family)
MRLYFLCEMRADSPCGKQYSYGQEIEQVFSDNDAKATFFVNGNNWDCIYDQAEDLIARYNAGHLIGSHTWGHDDISTLSADELNDQLAYVEEALKKILGVKPRFFRESHRVWDLRVNCLELTERSSLAFPGPPYGSYSSEALQVLRNRGYTGESIILPGFTRVWACGVERSN